MGLAYREAFSVPNQVPASAASRPASCVFGTRRLGGERWSAASAISLADPRPGQDAKLHHRPEHDAKVLGPTYESRGDLGRNALGSSLVVGFTVFAG